jgi:hypothetical protein
VAPVLNLKHKILDNRGIDEQLLSIVCAARDEIPMQTEVIEARDSRRIATGHVEWRIKWRAMSPS